MNKRKQLFWDNQAHDIAGLWRRIAILTYDGLILLALLMLSTLVLLPFTHGQAIPSNDYFYKIYLILVPFGFYSLFWKRGGQTLGMKVWRTKIVSTTGQPIKLWQLAVRFFTAILSYGLAGMGFWWMIVDNKRMTWHDRLSKTQLIKLANAP